MRAVLFDVDGVLLDSAAGHRVVWSRWCESRALDFDTVWPATHGSRTVDTVRAVAAHLDPETERDVLAALFAAQEVSAFPGAAELLTSLPVDRWAVVTSAQRVSVIARFPAAGLPLPSTIVGANEVAAGKPNPEGYLLAAERLGAVPADCLVVEDAPVGVAAAKAAGMTALAIGSSYIAAELGAADEFQPTLCAAQDRIRRWIKPTP